MSIISVAQNPMKTNIEEDEMTIFVSDPLPQYPGGEQKMQQYLFSNFSISGIDKEMIPNTRAVINFVVDEEGCINNIKILKSFGIQELDDEFIRVIASMPQWKPAMRYGKAIKVNWNIPLRINLK